MCSAGQLRKTLATVACVPKFRTLYPSQVSSVNLLWLAFVSLLLVRTVVYAAANVTTLEVYCHWNISKRKCASVALPVRTCYLSAAGV